MPFLFPLLGATALMTTWLGYATCKNAHHKYKKSEQKRKKIG